MCRGMSLGEAGKDRLLVRGRKRRVHSATDHPCGVHALPAQHLDDLLSKLSELDAVLGDIGECRRQSQHVARSFIRVEAEQQVGARQVKDRQRMGLDELRVVHQAPKLDGDLGDFHGVECV